jgi:hypothetical protein
VQGSGRLPWLRRLRSDSGAPGLGSGLAESRATVRHVKATPEGHVWPAYPLAGRPPALWPASALRSSPPGSTGVSSSPHQAQARVGTMEAPDERRGDGVSRAAGGRSLGSRASRSTPGFSCSYRTAKRLLVSSEHAREPREARGYTLETSYAHAFPRSQLAFRPRFVLRGRIMACRSTRPPISSVSRRTVHAWEHGLSLPGFRQLVAIRTAFEFDALSPQTTGRRPAV